ncbi:MAG: hypothetical protein EAX89_02065 [Candidatus Lokiarchaeota archaeon]|nr:hypothetical protein [Candidatus Lokiarchaeota archaeon]
MKILQDIWILTESGIVLYHREFNENMDDQLFGGLMAAINSFVEELIKDGLSSFELQNKRFSILKRNSIIFIAVSSKKIKEKKVLEELQLIAKKFFELYSEDIMKVWDNDTSRFLNFEKEIQSSLEETIKKFQDAFW